MVHLTAREPTHEIEHLGSLAWPAFHPRPLRSDLRADRAGVRPARWSLASAPTHGHEHHRPDDASDFDVKVRTRRAHEALSTTNPSCALPSERGRARLARPRRGHGKARPA